MKDWQCSTVERRILITTTWRGSEVGGTEKCRGVLLEDKGEGCKHLILQIKWMRSNEGEEEERDREWSA